MIFSQRNCNYPQPIYATWWLSQFRRWGMVKTAPDYAAVTRRVIRPDLYLEAMKELGVKTAMPEVREVRLFDGAFDGRDPEKYARSFPIHSMPATS